VGGQTDTFRAELIGFWRETKDLISLDGPTADPDVFTFINLPDKVKARGFELTASGRASDWIDWRAAYTHAKTTQTGSPDQLAGVQRDHAMARLEAHAPDGRRGVAAQVNWTGDVFDNLPSGIGRVIRGNWTVVDISAWIDVGPGRLSAKLENALDEDYAVLTRRFFRDGTNAPFVGHFRGVPRTLHVAYAYSF
jgi:outer membrane receptor protein involved in Fe transport